MMTTVQYTNGFKAHSDGFPRHANPVAYCLTNGSFSANQAKLRDEWFNGWDAADLVAARYLGDTVYYPSKGYL
jgi:hypothetical protein